MYFPETIHPAHQELHALTLTHIRNVHATEMEEITRGGQFVLTTLRLLDGMHVSINWWRLS